MTSESVTEPPNDLLITAAQFAQKLQVSTRTLWRMRDAGRLPKSLQVGGGIRWRLSDVERWVADGCPAPASSDAGCEHEPSN